jgi:hypothetical protein
MRIQREILILAALMLLFVAHATYASPTYTVTNTNDSGPGSLRAAIANANSSNGSSVVCDPSLTGTITLHATLPTILTGMTITGPGRGSLNISGNNLYRCFAISAGSNTVTISGFAVIDGNDLKGDSGGGGFLIASGNVVLEYMDIEGCNSATAGGAILVDYGTLTVTEIYFGGCTASSTGAIIQNYATATIGGSTFYGNGGAQSTTGIHNEGELTVTDTELDGNNCTCIDNLNSATIDRVDFAENGSPTYGGAVHNYYGGTIDLQDCTFYLDGAKAQGSTIYNDGALTAENCTISDSYELGTHADVYNDTNGTAAFENSIILPSGPLTSVVPSALTVTYSDVYPVAYLGTGNISLPAALTSLDEYGGESKTCALLPGSPCLGTGENTGLSVDERGVAIPTGGPYDMGAFQSQGFIVNITSGNNQSATVGSQFPLPLTATVSAVSPIEPVAGGMLSVTTPTTGPSASLQHSHLATSNPSTYATANATPGSYAVVFDTGAGVANFMLTNKAASK